MFQQKTLRFFCGTLLGSIGLLLVGALYHTIRWGRNSAITEPERLQLLVIMLAFGSFYGLVLGGIIGIAPRPARVGIGAAAASLAAVFLLRSQGPGEAGADNSVEVATLAWFAVAPMIGGVLGGLVIPDLGKKFAWGESFFGPSPEKKTELSDSGRRSDDAERVEE